jgi:hypothetical protein
MTFRARPLFNVSRTPLTIIFGLALVASAASAQGAKPTGKAPAKSAKAATASVAGAQPLLAGLWSGTATVPLPDSTIVVPVFYTFTDTPAGIAGTAMVPGQGSGPISHVVRSGTSLRFRVDVKEGALEHDAKFNADGSIDGMVNLNNQPLARFRILPKKSVKP